MLEERRKNTKLQDTKPQKIWREACTKTWAVGE